MIICSINSETKDIKLTSFMRDTYVAIPGYSKNRLNAAHAFGGVSLLDETMEKNFGIHIDGNVVVNFDNFIEAMAQVGDIELEISQAEANAINREGHFNIKAGKVALKPEEALMYVRIRHTGGGDFERTERQRKFIMAAFNKIRKLPISEMMSLADKLLPCFATDMNKSTILGYITQIGGGGYSMGETLRIPIDGAWKYAMINDTMSVILPDLQKNSDAIKEFIYGQIAGQTENTAQ
jgi:LCP family protein required for cell wall assembly